MSLVNLGLIFVAIIDLCFAVFIYFSNPKNKINISFALTIFFVSSWTLGIAMFREAQTEYSALIWIWIQNGSGSLIVIPFFLFSLYFPYQRNVLKLWQKFFIAVSIMFVILDVITPNAWTKEIQLIPSKNDFSVNFWGVLYFVFFFYFYTILSFYNLLIKYLHSQGFIKIQLIYLLAATGIIAIFGAFFGAILPFILLRSGGLYWIGPYFAVPMVFILSYFIYRSRY